MVSTIQSYLTVAVFFLLSNIYLVVAPFIPPSEGQNVYESLPYYLHCLVGIGILVGGVAYWLIWAIIAPKLGKYELVRETYYDEIDGWERNRFKRVALNTRSEEEVIPEITAKKVSD